MPVLITGAGRPAQFPDLPQVCPLVARRNSHVTSAGKLPPTLKKKQLYERTKHDMLHRAAQLLSTSIMTAGRPRESQKA